MTCREFRRAAAQLTLPQLVKSQDTTLLAHGRECSVCGGWLAQQRSLANTLRVLQTSTADCEAGPEVEQQVLRWFRATAPIRVQVPEIKPAHPVMFLSRMFGFGAYAALAAALLIAIGAGAWLMYRPAKQGEQSQQARSTTSRQPTVVATNTEGSGASTAEKQHSSARRSSRSVSNNTRDSQAGTDALLAQFDSAGYVPLMLCDPLSCSGDESVVRMELPASAANSMESSSQPLIADVVVGDDGLVRAIRIVQ